MNKSLPEASNALTLGILSIVITLFCCGPFGAILGFIGLSKAKKAESIFNLNPGEYSGYDNIKTGRILSYIGIGIAAMYLLFFIIYFGAIIAYLIALFALQGCQIQ
ncbi:hypothetical protein KO500_09170 [Cellulophaga baltica]|uniref:CCC motif membrane protein n=1 Tax=Cellulophaga TaxID=104264 RepID=UPI001C0797F4|nr:MULTISPECIES: CCC motif membrane protein [Cellulophaga]MBU2996605.1 hypothetical protein [Cellulophaga baltica]MDO6767999.1 CCC motif membrane protein [Cellulophaga sp. 1_MG-2023]